MADSIFVDTKQLTQIALELKGFEKEVVQAAYSALNRTLSQVVTQVGRIVPKAYAVKAKDVKTTFRVKRVSKANLEAMAISIGPTLSLAHFPFSPRNVSRKRYKVKVKIKKDQGVKPINTNPKPFLMHTGAKSAEKVQYNVFRRTTSKRFPVVLLRTLSIPQMITNENVSEQIQQFASDKFSERLQHEIIFRMTKLGK